MNYSDPTRIATYTFYKIENCNMCHASSEKFKVLGKRLNGSQGFNPQLLSGITTTVMKCQNCGLIFSNPQPIPSSIDDHYDVEPEDYWTDEYFKIDAKYFSGEIDKLQKLMDIKPGMRSLDIGAGLGKQMIALKKIGFETYGIEPSPSFHRMAIKRMGIDPEYLQNSSIEDAQYESNTFDFISFGVVLEHIYDPSKALKKALDWLKPSGVCHIEVPNANWLVAKLLNGQYRLRGKDYVTNISPMHSPFHLHEFTIRAFEENSKINNYGIVKSGQYVCRTTLPRFLDPVLKPIMEKTQTGMQLHIWLCKR